MISKYALSLMRGLSILVVLSTSISVTLIATAPPSDDLRNLEPGTLKTAILAMLVIFGLLLPLIAMISSPRSWLLAKAAMFALAGLANAVTLSPLVSVPFQSVSSFVAIVASFVMAIVCVLVFQENTERQKPASKF